MASKQWYVIIGGKDKGPFSTEEIIRKLHANELNQNFYAHTNGQTPALIIQIPEFQNWKSVSPSAQNSSSPHQGTTSPSGTQANLNKSASSNTSSQSQSGFLSSTYKPTNSHEIDYRIVGDEMQFVEIELDPQESVVAEAGAMMYMNDYIQMDTIFGDGSQKDENKGLFGKFLAAGSRIITGESLFMTMFSNVGSGKRRVAFASPFPGKIVPLDLQELNGKVICQKDAFLCAAKGVSVGIEFNKKISAGFLGGEGFIMQKLEGDGLAFIHASGTITEISLNAGERLKVDTGCLVGFTREVKYEIEFVRGIKSMFFGGEGICFALMTGPGKVWVQSLPFSRLAGRIAEATVKQRGEGSVLGGLGNVLGGDRNF